MTQLMRAILLSSLVRKGKLSKKQDEALFTVMEAMTLN